MMTIEQLIKVVREKLDKEPATEHRLELAVAATIDGLGFSVNERTGEIVDPRPQPVNVFTPPRQQNVRWRGGRRPR